MGNRHPDSSVHPATRRSPPGGNASGGAAQPASEPLLRTLVVQGASLLGVAAVVLALVDDRNAETQQRLDNLEAEIALVRQERDRMQALSEELTRELDDAAMEAEIVRWQLAYTEERLARTKGNTEPRAVEVGPPARFAVLAGAAAEERGNLGGAALSHLSYPSETVSLFVGTESTAIRWADGPAAASWPVGDMGVGQPTEVAFLAGRGARGPLDWNDDSTNSTRLAPAVSQLARDRAYSAWSSLMDEAADGECQKRSGQAQRRCRDRVRRQLTAWSTRAVDCMLSGNAEADYVQQIRLDQIPTHSVPLETGAVILCDGDLRNF